MKKHYISPEVLFDEMVPDSLLNSASISGIDNGDLQHIIETGGDAGSGVSSDSRRHRDIWGDDEDMN